MARTTVELVGAIIELDPTITDLTRFIEAANQLVTELCEPKGASVDRLTEIETWLAAHFYAIRDPRPLSEQAGSVGATYQSRVDLGLAVTHYGQMAMALDTSGALASLNQMIKNGKKRPPKVLYVGSTDE